MPSGPFPCRRLSTVVVALMAVIVFSRPVGAQPIGQVTFSGPAAPILPSTTFVPDSFQELGPGWNFFDPSGTFVVGVTHFPGNTGTILGVQVNVGPVVWSAGDALGLTGVMIDGHTVTFTNITLAQVNPPADNDLTLDGSLTRPVGIATEAWSFGRVKGLFSR